MGSDLIFAAWDATLDVTKASGNATGINGTEYTPGTGFVVVQVRAVSRVGAPSASLASPLLAVSRTEAVIRKGSSDVAVMCPQVQAAPQFYPPQTSLRLSLHACFPPLYS